MATIGGLTTSTSSSIRGYGGLASGLDRDTLIEGMTSGTTSKITQQQKKQQQLEWKQAAIQNITGKLLDFANKYTSSWSSNTNLFSSVFWGRNKITTTGENSKYVSISGTANSGENIKIMGVKQMAEKATWSAQSGVSSSKLETGNVNFETVQNLVGKTLTFDVDGKAYTVTLAAEDANGNKYDYTNATNISNAINAQLANAKSADGKETKDLSGMINSGITSGGKITIEQKSDNIGTKGTSLKMTGGSAIGFLGFNSPAGENWELVKADGETGDIASGEVKNLTTDFDHRIAGKGMQFSYNGASAIVYMPSAEELQASKEEILNRKNEDGTPVTKNENRAKMIAIQESIQKQLDSAFGKNRVQVDVEVNKDVTGKVKGFGLAFSTIKKEGGENVPDPTSTLTLTDGNAELIQNVLNTRAGESNRVNLSAKLSESGLKFPSGADAIKFEGKEQIFDQDKKPVLDENNNPTYRNKTTIKINGVDIDVYEDDTMNALMDRINRKTDLNVRYQAETDKFIFSSKEDGASGTVDLKTGNEDANSKALINALFGTGASDVSKTGQDAIIAVQYPGSNEVVELNRGSNSFNVDGLTVNIKGEFGYKEVAVKKADGTSETNADGTPKMEIKRDESVEAIEIDAQVNADSIVDAVKGMIEEYNSIIELVNKEVKTKPDRDYEPLTSEQKKELSDDEVETWEKKAKEGILYADSDIRNLSSDLRFIIDGGYAQELANMGISTSSTYSDNGKINFDESKFRAALASNPERVQEIFANESVKNTNGNGYSKGVATNLKNVLDKYVNTMGAMESKGILIRKAGHESSPMSVTENTMYKQLDAIKKKITELQERLETERDRYIKQFTSLETLISQMNSQSSWLSQFGGY